MIFTFFLHIMVGQNTKKSNVKETTFFNSYDVMLEYIFTKKCTLNNAFKMQIYFKNDWNDF
jgi:hypothetical protein